MLEPQNSQKATCFGKRGDEEKNSKNQQCACVFWIRSAGLQIHMWNATRRICNVCMCCFNCSMYINEDTTVCSSIDEDTFARQYMRFVPTNDVNFVVGLKLLSDSRKREEYVINRYINDNWSNKKITYVINHADSLRTTGPLVVSSCRPKQKSQISNHGNQRIKTDQLSWFIH